MSDLDDFEAGYNGTVIETPTGTLEPKPAEVPPKAEEANDPLAQIIERMQRLEQTSDKLAGHIGGITRTQKDIQDRLAASLQATSTVRDAPTQAQAEAAAGNTKKWDDLKSQFPEWGEATEELMNHRLATFKAPQGMDQAAIDRIVNERTNSVRTQALNSTLDSIVDGDWEETVNTKAFNDWFNAQPADIKKLSESDDVRDAAKMLRLFKRREPEKVEPKKDVSRAKRIEAAVEPKGTGANPPGKSDVDEFEAGYYG